ncbi:MULTISPECIES: flagellin [Phyllobacterium]|jgi:flagellin|uniref:Flagellin n=3 Tax=Phyllobacterium TaxID=28100 RepID=A0A2P7AP12_9HYPH|nr:MULTISPECIES: flagellin [Phyllobacterium]MBB3233713.1 flagellin [Phyllobacterium endophyticum]PSH55942.1 flagellin [Phyllobacterium endophyticum]RCW82265.1 flagellin [Phyllobacterium bourgognense]TXR47202.1 flagellin [Phyllobacterium endophyticum]TYR41086.1 flagellin [Phyllobacterium endophyticum]
MTSILTNASAMTALQTLNTTNKNLATTQDRIATGQRVSTASDNAAYWSIATGMRTQNSALSAVKDGLGLGASIVDTAYTALTSAIDLASKIQAKYVAKETPGTDGTIIDADIAEMKAQIVEMAQGATFQGVNLLETGGAAQNIVTGYTSGTGVTTMSVAAYDLEAALTAATSSSTVETAVNAMKAAAAALGSAKTRIDTQQTFTGNLMDAIDRGVGQLVDADMNAESARLSALQVQQQLGIQALSIANSSNQSILSLFRG